MSPTPCPNSLAFKSHAPPNSSTGLYRTNAHRRINGRAIPYKLTEIDFIAAYVIPEDSWFILPLRDILGRTSLLFRRKRDRRRGIYDSYREAWRLLRIRP
ncbi:MAG TPA: hypothetical protein VGM18_19730 [Candidatus Sulfotelmatobacter sp.]|jgi:hypothetical protein